jgi:hypothetical protein
MPGFMNGVGVRGFCGMGRGRGGGRGGRGWRNRFHATGLTGWQRAAMGYPAFGVAMSGEQQLDALKGQAEYFEDALEGIRKRIEELEARSKKD